MTVTVHDDFTRPGSTPLRSTPEHDAVELTGGGNLAFICLNEQTYTLRITRQGKLILTK